MKTETLLYLAAGALLLLVIACKSGTGACLLTATVLPIIPPAP